MPGVVGRVAALIEQAGYAADHPIVVGVQLRGASPVFVARGSTSTGEPLTPSTIVYAASLAKQVTAAGAALLVHQGRLDIDSTLAHRMPELPGWAESVRLRQLVHHIGGLPADVRVDAAIAGERDRTTAAVIRALGQFPALDDRPGTRYVYCNAGYVCLAVAVERAAGQPLPDFARQHLFAPLGMASSRYWSGPAPQPPGGAPLPSSHPAPLSLGDGGVWSTAADLIRWNAALDADVLGISALVGTPGRLDDQTPVDYAWGVGVRTDGGHRVCRHGGGWPGLRAQLIRAPDQRTSFVILAMADETDRSTTLANALLDELG